MKHFKASLLVVAMFGLAACQPEATKTEETVASSEQTAQTQDQNAYALGVSIGSVIQNAHSKYGEADITLDKQQILAGIRDVLADKANLSREEANELLRALETQAQQNMAAINEKKSAQNIADGKAYMEENAKREEVTTTESGLQYEVLVEGDGVSPEATDTVTVHYRGTLIDGTEFDSSFSRNQPTTFPLNRVIAGWTEGLQLMKTGAKYRFVIPAELAYGERSMDVITPNSTLVFEVELLEVKKADAPQTDSE